MLPKELYNFFWEHIPAKFDEDTYWYFTIERLLEHGNDQAIRWLFKHYTQEKIIEVVKSSWSISKKTANLWIIKRFLSGGQNCCRFTHGA